MRRYVDFLAPLGLVVIVAYEAVSRGGKTLPGKPAAYWIAGGALIFAHLLFRWEDLVKFIGRRQLRYGGNTMVLVIVVLGILGAVNYLVARHSQRWDLTKGHRYSLSDQTTKVLGNLKQDIKFVYFQKTSDMSFGKDELQQYQSASPKVKLEFVDPLKNPTAAHEYDITQVPTLVIERDKKREKVSGRAPGEQDITNALIKVTHEGKKTICFTEGEGERDLDDPNDGGFSNVKSSLGKNQYETQKVLLMREGKVPETCSVLVVAGPQRDLLPPAIDAIRRYAKSAGKALIMVEPEIKESFPNLVALLKEWNIEAGNDIVVDESPMAQYIGITTPLAPLAAQYPYHEITKNFRVATVFLTARSMEAGKGTPEGVSAQSLLQTSKASYAKTDLKAKSLEMDEKKDRPGPISLGAVATLRAPEDKPAPGASPSPGASGDPPKPKPEGRVVAFGDSDFATNQLLGFQGNEDFFLNTVAWLAEDPDLIAIRAKEPDDQRMFVTRQQQMYVMIFALLLLPGSFVLAGVVVWWTRR